MTEKNIKFEIKDRIATIYINRPKQMNALNFDTVVDLTEALSKVESDKDVLGIIITGAGDKAFVAGADISLMKGITVFQARTFAQAGQTVFDRIENCPKPVIAVVNGYALGGGMELAMSCDIVLASDKSMFGQPEVKLGIIPGFGGTQRLVRRAGMHIAKELIFTGDMISAERALQIGIVSAIYPADVLMEKAIKMMKTIMANAPVAIAMAKNAINMGADQTLSVGLAVERDSFAQLFATEDQKEGMNAFLEKREAKFKGN